MDGGGELSERVVRLLLLQADLIDALLLERRAATLPATGVCFKDMKDEFSIRVVEHYVNLCNGRTRAAARLMGMAPKNVHYWLNKRQRSIEGEP